RTAILIAIANFACISKPKHVKVKTLNLILHDFLHLSLHVVQIRRVVTQKTHSSPLRWPAVLVNNVPLGILHAPFWMLLTDPNVAVNRVVSQQGDPPFSGFRSPLSK